MSKEVLIITGSGRGIGAATAIRAAEKGYAVCINYNHNIEAANQIVAQINQSGGTAVAFKADVSHEEEVEQLFQFVDRELGMLTALVNNAGIIGKQMRLDEMDSARLHKVFSTNISGYFLCSREAVRRMSTKHGGQGGCIVNVSSTAARYGSPGRYIDYAASKGAVDTLTVGLAHEVAEENIRVNGVRPGFIYTDIHATSGEPDRVEKLKANVPMKRGGEPREIANAIIWLLSNEASYITGSIVDVSGGR